MKKALFAALVTLLLPGCVAPYCAQQPKPSIYNTIPQASGYAPPYPPNDIPPGGFRGKLPFVRDTPHWTPGD